MRNNESGYSGDADDGRVIASMNIEGMPWYAPGAAAGTRDSSVPFPAGKMTRRESLAFTFGVLKAILVISAVFLGTLFAFILFCTNVWLK